MFDNNKIILSVLFSFLFAAVATAQVLEISGTVTDQTTGEGLPGANVQVKGTNLGTATGADGRFSIRLPNFSQATLAVSFIGFKTAEIAVASSTDNLVIALEEDILKTSEIIVTGLATSVKRRNLANSVGTVTAKELVPAPAQTLERAMNGKMAGITVSQNTGAPGGGIFVNLRGTSTIEGSTEPLYVVDGVIVNNSAIQSGIDLVTSAAAAGSPRPQGQPSNRIADLNPNDIENIEVLKGPSAAAIYGSKASNGVIIITTKQGSPGKTRIDVTQQFGFNTILNKIGTRKFTPETAEALVAGGADLLAQNGNIDYEDELFGKEGFINESTVSVRGGSERTQFYVGGVYQDEDGIIKNTGYKKYSGKGNINHRISDKLRLSVFTTFARTESDRSITGNENAGATTLGFALAATPAFIDIRPRRLTDGTLVFPDNPSAGSNPLHTVDAFVNNEVVYRTIGSGRLLWNVFKNQRQALDFTLQAGIDFFSMENKVISPPELQFERQKDLSTRGSAINGETESLNSNFYLHGTYSYHTASNVMFRTSAGLQFENQNRNNLIIKSDGLVSGQGNADQAASATAFQTKEKQRERGLFLQEELDLNDKIYLTAGLRGDASSANGDTDKLYFYPKGSASVRLSQYGILTSLFDELKIRGAYGETGNLPRPEAKFISLTPANTGGVVGGLNPTRRGNPDIKPERSREIEVGFDATFFNSNATLEFSYYRQYISDLILVNNLPPSSGFEEEFINAGDMRTQGFEASVGFTPYRRKNFSWTSRLNFYRTVSEITSLDVDPFTTGGFALSLGEFEIKEGKSPTTIVGLDENGNKVDVGNETPDFQLSFNNNFTILRNIELSFLWDWKQGGDVINLGRFLTDDGGTSDDLDTPAGQARANGTATKRYIEDGSYLKLRELSVSYNFPSSFVRRVFSNQLSYLRLGFAARNLLMFTGYDGYDPEVSQFGNLAIGRSVDTLPFPSSRSIYFNVAFGL